MSEGGLDTGRRGVGEREVDGPDVDEQGVDEQGVDEQDASSPGAKTETTLRLDGLGAAVEAARGRLDHALLREAADVVSRGRRRLGLSSEHTIVALAGATGSGKSSLFNALCDLDLAAVGVKRPTTSWALACAWGSDGASEILDWLGIPTRHQVNRTGLLDETVADRDLHGLVLLDLPDHDSTEVSHRLEVERLVELADVMVWVLDPQKYADAVIHDRYLRPLSSHAEVMLVALNHVDEIPPGEVESCLLDVRRLLELDGLGNVPVLATSATEGRGITELRQILVRKVSDKRSARERVDADVAGMARRLEQQAGSAQGVELGADLHKQLLDACVDSAGVPVIVGALESTALISARRATAWPVAAWLGGMRSDPMSRLPDPDTPATRRADPPSGFEDEAAPTAAPTGAPTGAPTVTPTPAPTAAPVAHAPAGQRVKVDAAVRKVVDEMTNGMGMPWQQAVRGASTARLDAFARSLESTVSPADMSATGGSGWWSLVRGLQWLLVMTAVAGGLWLLTVVTLDALDERPMPAHRVGGISMPPILLIGGLALGLVTSILGSFAAGAWARRKAANADRCLRTAVATKTDEFVLSPLTAETDAYLRCQAGVRAALGR